MPSSSLDQRSGYITLTTSDQLLIKHPPHLKLSRFSRVTCENGTTKFNHKFQHAMGSKDQTSSHQMGSLCEKSEEALSSTTGNETAFIREAGVFELRSSEHASDFTGDRFTYRATEVFEHSEYRRESGPSVPLGPSGCIPEWVVLLKLCRTQLYRVYLFIRRVLY